MRISFSIKALGLVLVPFINNAYGTPQTIIDKPEFIKENRTHFNVTQNIAEGQASVRVTLFHENCIDPLDPDDVVRVIDPIFSGGEGGGHEGQPSSKPTSVPSGMPSSLPVSLPTSIPSSIPTESSVSPSEKPSLLPSASESNQNINLVCPDIGAEPLEVVPEDGIFSIQTTSNNELCTLTLKTTTSTLETLAPLARSYDGHDWETVAGPHSISFQCNGNKCDGSAPSIDPNTQVFLLTSFGTSSNLKSEDIAARFFEQTTLGTTKSDILPWKDQVVTSSSTLASLDYSFAEWIKNQYDNVPLTSFRQYFREQANTRVRNVKLQGAPLHACDPNTRWQGFAFNRKDATDFYGFLEVTRTSDGSGYLLSVDGVPRTEVGSVEVVGFGDLPVPGTYSFCFYPRVEEFFFGQLEVVVNGVCRRLAIGNPIIRFFSSNPQKPPKVITLDPSFDASQFIKLPDTVSDGEFLLPNGLDHSDCDQISVKDFPVYLEFSNGLYLAFDPRLSMADNTLENPLPDGGGQTELLGSRCSNVPRTFLNADSCVLSDVSSACSNEVAFTDTEIPLTRDNLYALYDLTGKYVYAIDGLRVHQSPCIFWSRSRWQRINNSASCPNGETAFSDSTGVVLKAYLENPAHVDFWLRDIIAWNSNAQCTISSSTPSSTKDIKIIADNACWKLVHPDHYSVYDMTPWVSVHPGGADRITKWAVPGGMVLMYPHPEDMTRWETNKQQFPLVGLFDGTVPFRDLPSNLRLESVIDYFGIGSSVSGDKIVICGSPNEVATNHALGETGLAMSIGDLADDAFEWDKMEQRDIVWLKTVLSANDQLRQRVAWGFSQIFPIDPESSREVVEAESHLAYYDIFVRNAFGNYFDILKEVSYSPMMAHMLSFIKNTSTYYNKQIWQTISNPDENYAREIMQLFTIGTVLLNMDGTLKLDPTTGDKISTYTNDHIMSYARAWTGFDHQQIRGNFERTGINQPNRLDPMRIQIDWRDILPKIDLKDGYIGDGYPLCSDMPERSFLRKGALYRLLGSSTNLQLSDSPPVWTQFDPTKKMLSLDPSSELYNVLCSPTSPGGSDCSFKSQVKITENLACFGQECLVDTLSLLEVTPGIHFEYVRQPCVELSYYQNPTTVTWPFRNWEMCADPKTIVAREACCSPGATNADEVFCEYANERVTLETAENRCASVGKEICNYNMLSVNSLDPETCGAHYFYYHWHGSECLLKVKINNESGYAAIVHQPTAMINDNIEKRFREDSIYFFPVHWDSADYPDTSNSCGGGACTAIEGGCLCNTAVVEDVAFSSAPADADDILSTLHVGSVSPDTYDDGHFDSPVTQGDYQVYFRSGQSYDMDTVFRVQVNTQVKYYKNIVSTVQVITASGGTTSYSFRNPPHFINFQVPDGRDAYHETDAVLESYFYHPNMAPFVASYMIQKLGISNPSPRYVEAVVTAFKTGVYDYDDGSNPVISYGTNKYGDLRSTIAAIILDRESRSLVLDNDSSKGSLREPLLKVVAFMRSMKYESFPAFRSGRRDHKLFQMTSKIGQMVFASPSIFSFFRPEFVPVGSIGEASLVSPEAQQYVSHLVIGLMNGLFALIKWGLAECYGGFARNKTFCTGKAEGDREAAWGEVTFAPQDSTNYANTVDELATLLTAGRLSTESRNLIANEMAGTADDAAALRLAQQLIVVSPEFHSTNAVKFTGEDRLPPPPAKPSSNPFKAVVYLFLPGAIDSFNILVPHSGCTKDMYAEYASVRGYIAIPPSKLLPIGTGGEPQVCSTFGIHSDLPVLQELYNSKDLSFFANVGFLTEEVTKENWLEKTKTQLFAHNILQKDTQQMDPFDFADGTGVIGRMADVLTKKGYNTGSYSMSGDNFVLLGEPFESPEVNHFNFQGVKQFNEIPSIDGMNVTMAKINNPTTTMSGKFGKTWSDTYDSSIRQNGHLYDAVNELTLATNFPNTGIAQRMKHIASVIKARNELGNDRQFFFVNEHGWDTHGFQKETFDRKLPQVDGALRAFRDEMKAQGLWDSVTLVMASEFGRTLVPNSSDGTDHAWGGNYFVMGGSMNGIGGKILGEYPNDLTDAGPLTINRGRLIPTTSWDAILNAVAQWSGITDEADMAKVLPNRNNFSRLFTRDDLFKPDP